MKSVAVVAFIFFSLIGSLAEAQQYQGKVFCGGSSGYAGEPRTLLGPNVRFIDPNYRTISTIQPLFETAKAMIERECLSPMIKLGKQFSVSVFTPSGQRAMELEWEGATGVFKVTRDTRAEAARFDAGERPKNCGLCTYDDIDCRSSCQLLDQACRKTCDMKKDACTRQNCSN